MSKVQFHAFPLEKGTKECGTLPSWLFNFAVAYPIMKVEENHESMESNSTELHHAYANGDNFCRI
jgi:hypothetical protein